MTLGKVFPPPMRRIWVCESCGDVWQLPAFERPAKDRDGRVLCEPCRLFAGVNVTERRP